MNFPESKQPADGQLWRAIVVVAGGVSVTLGCGLGGARVDLPELDPASAGAQALEQFDTNGDARLSADELGQCPGIGQALSVIDSDKDGAVTADEIAARVQHWIDDRVGLMPISALVLLDRRPLPGAEVELIPESFLGPAVKPATATSDASGAAHLSIASEHLPDDLRGMMVVMPGIYRVKVNHPQKKLPAGYRDGTALGQEIGYDTNRGRIVIELKSK